MNRVRLRSVEVVAISPARYPQFCKDRENPYSAQPDDVRAAEVEDICAQLLVQSSLERPAPNVNTPLAA